MDGQQQRRPRKALYFFCVGKGYDYVSRMAFERTRDEH